MLGSKVLYIFVKRKYRESNFWASAPEKTLFRIFETENGISIVTPKFQLPYCEKKAEVITIRTKKEI